MGEKKLKPGLIVFDLNGVLVDVSGACGSAVKKTAEFFLGKLLDDEKIPLDHGHGLTDILEASERLIAKHTENTFRRHAVMKKFQEFYIGRNLNGFILDEEPLVDAKWLKKFKRTKLAIVTDRHPREAAYVLRKFKLLDHFKDIVGIEEWGEDISPSTNMTNLIRKLKGRKKDTVYIAGSSDGLKISNEANVPFIGVVPPHANKAVYKEKMQSSGANVILDSIQDLPKLF